MFAILLYVWYLFYICCCRHLNTSWNGGTAMQDTSFQSQHTSAYVQTVDCSPNVPCVYPNQVDFRIIVITYNRANSTRKALQAIDSVCLDGATSTLEIWIDQSKSNFVHYPTVEVARTFKWSKDQLEFMSRISMWAYMANGLTHGSPMEENWLLYSRMILMYHHTYALGQSCS